MSEQLHAPLPSSQERAADGQPTSGSTVPKPVSLRNQLLAASVAASLQLFLPIFIRRFAGSNYYQRDEEEVMTMISEGRWSSLQS